MPLPRVLIALALLGSAVGTIGTAGAAGCADDPAPLAVARPAELGERLETVIRAPEHDVLRGAVAATARETGAVGSPADGGVVSATVPGLYPAGDLDGDGAADAVELTSDGDVAGVRGQDGADLWAAAGRADAVYAVGDLDGAAGDDLLALSSELSEVGNAQVRRQGIQGVRGRDGAVLWSREDLGVVNLLGGYQQLVLPLGSPVDLDGDGRRDLLIGTYSYEGHVGLPRARFEAISGATGATFARYALGVGVWGGATPLFGLIKQLPLAAVVPDLTGDCRPDVAVTVARQQTLVVAVFAGTGGVPVWHAELPADGTQRLVDLHGAVLGADRIGDVLLTFGIPGNAPASGSQLRLVALSGRDGAAAWTSTFPQNLSRIVVQRDAEGRADMLLLYGAGGRRSGILGLIDGATGASRWQRHFEGDPAVAGDLTGDGVDDILVGLESCVQGCVATGAELVSGGDGATAWIRPAVAGERLVPAGGDLDGDGIGDLHAVTDAVGGGSRAYAAVAGRDGSASWRDAQVVPGDAVLQLAVLDIRSAPGLDVLETLTPQSGTGSASARAGGDGTSLWLRR